MGISGSLYCLITLGGVMIMQYGGSVQEHDRTGSRVDFLWLPCADPRLQDCMTFQLACCCSSVA